MGNIHQAIFRVHIVCGVRAANFMAQCAVTKIKSQPNEINVLK